jgi:hypothetical protein
MYESLGFVKGFIGNLLDCIDVSLFCTVGIISRSGYCRKRGLFTLFTNFEWKKPLVTNFFCGCMLGFTLCIKKTVVLCILFLSSSTAECSQTLGTGQWKHFWCYMWRIVSYLNCRYLENKNSLLQLRQLLLLFWFSFFRENFKVEAKEK